MSQRAALFFYTGNVCSTPTVGNMARFNGVSTPIFEHLDAYSLLKAGIPTELLDITFNSALSDLSLGRQSALLRDLGLQAREPSELLAFKWRPFLYNSEHLVERRRILASFRSSVPFVIVRRSLKEHALKIFCNEALTGSRNPQFRDGNASVPEHERRLQKLREAQLVLKQEDLKRIERLGIELLARTRKTIQLAVEHFPHGQLHLLVAESLFEPELNWEKYKKYFVEILNLEEANCQHAASSELGGKRFSRVGFQSANIANLDDLHASPQLAGLEEEYMTLINSPPLTSPDWMKVPALGQETGL